METVRARGQGTKLKDGRWRVVVCRLVDGRETRKEFTAKTQREAQAKAKAWTPKHQPDITLSALLDKWLESRKGQVADSTYRSYDMAVRKIKPLIGFIRLSALLPSHFEGAYKNLNGTRLPGQVRTVMGTAIEYARKNRYMLWNPAQLSDVPKTGKAPERPRINQTNFDRIVEATELPLFSILWHFLAQTGLRPGKEALRTRKSHFWQDEDGWWVRVPDSKTPSGERDVPITPELYAMVNGLDGEELWPGVSLRYVNDKWHEALEKAGVPRTNPYQLRHFFATKTAKKGAKRKTVSALLGHSDERLADRYYVHEDREDLRNAIN